MAELSGHVAIVTGGGRGLGRAVAERLAGMGAAVVVAPGFSCRMQIAHFAGRTAVHTATVLRGLGEHAKEGDR